MRRKGAWTAALAVSGLLLSCAIPTGSSVVGALPDSASFIDTGVSKFMEQRCGGLDCHGQPGRPLRIYSEWGLRLEARSDGTRDRRPTTAEERLENYRSAVGLEPENLARCFETKGDYDTFQLLLKPLDTANDGIRHKGGPVLRPTPSDPGWQCLYGWASGSVNAEECAKAARIE